MNVSEHITYGEAVKSQTATRKGIDNTPNEKELEAMRLVAEKIFEPVRNHFGIPIGVSSFFRSKKLNRAIGGSKSSQHCKGEAIDIDADIYGGVTNLQIFEWIRDNLTFDQLIKEYGTENDPAWIHVSYKKTGNRNMVFRIS